MVEYDDSVGFNIEALVRRLERAGANVSDYKFHDPINIYTVDFYMSGQDPDEIFPSSTELTEDGVMEMAQIRMPTFTAEPDVEGADYEGYESAKRGAVDKVWNELKDDIGEILNKTVGANYEYGVVQDEGIVIRAQRGYTSGAATPHIEFLRTRDGNAPIGSDEMVNVVRELNELWQNEYFYVETVGRSDAF